MDNQLLNDWEEDKTTHETVLTELVDRWKSTSQGHVRAFPYRSSPLVPSFNSTPGKYYRRFPMAKPSLTPKKQD